MIDRKKRAAILAALFLFGGGAAFARDFDWTGTWRGSAGLNEAEVAIAGARVRSVRLNGRPQSIASASVSGATVSITGADGSKIKLYKRDARRAKVSWRGKAVRFTSTLQR